jgi:FdhE protein
VQEALGELQQLTKERPALVSSAALLSELLPLLYAKAIIEIAPELTSAQVHGKLGAGTPLLRGETLRIDGDSLRRRWRHVCAAVDRHQGGRLAGQLDAAVGANRLDPDQWIGDVLEGRPEAIYTRAQALALDANLAATILRLTMFPVLEAIQTALAPLRVAASWQRGFCPTCGGEPLLGEYRGLEQIRFLRCGLCAGEWELPRLQCPFCGTRDHHDLGYFHLEGEDARHRAAACARCRRYVKIVATLGPLSGPRLLVADVATLHLDLAAAQQGYTG